MNGTAKVWEAVETFRRQYLARAGGALPVDVFSLVELQLRLDVIPFDDLQAKYRIDAALTQDFTGMYVDAESYVFWERGPVWKQNRLRFTVAHEIGHWVLHRDYAAKIKFGSFDHFAGTSRATTRRATGWSRRPTSLPAGCWCRSGACGNSSTSSRGKSPASARRPRKSSIEPT